MDYRGPIPLEQQRPKFETGKVVITPAASAALASCGHTLDDVLARHKAGDWGDVPERIRAVNERGLVEQFNVQSAYGIQPDRQLVVVTNGERTLTMVHLDQRAAT